MDRLRCGVVGLGRGRLFVEKLAALPDCEVVAVCDPDESKLAALAPIAGYTDYDRFLAEANLDLIAVISPGPDHAPQSVAALRRGVHVISETPCVYSLEEAAEVVAAVRESGCRFMLAEDYIFMGWMERWREIVASGELGEIVAAQGEYTHDCRGIFVVDEAGHYLPWSARSEAGAHPSWRASDLPPLKYCSHTLGPLLHLMQDRCVTASGHHTGSHAFPEAGTVDLASAVLRTERGAVVTLTNGFGLAHPFVFLLGLYGTKGSIRCVSFGTPQVRVYTDVVGGEWSELQTEWSERPDGRDWLIVMLEGFVRSIREGGDPPIDVYTSLDYTVPGICAHLSADQGGVPVPVPDYRRS